MFWTPAVVYPRKGGGGSNSMAEFFGKLLNVLEPRKRGVAVAIWRYQY
jgi:hypothetical protein